MLTVYLFCVYNGINKGEYLGKRVVQTINGGGSIMEKELNVVEELVDEIPEDTSLDVEGVNDDDVEDSEEEEEDSLDLTVDDEQDDIDDSEDESEEYVDTEVDTPPKSKRPLFNEHQQKEVNRIVQTRLERQEAKLIKDLSQTAGVALEQQEVPQAAKLWGLLKNNEELSRTIDSVIGDYLASGRAVAPDTTQKSVDTVKQRLVLKEAILDLRAADNTFEKNSDKILAWAENEGFTVNDEKTLSMAYLAWKGSQGAVIDTIQRTKAQRQEQARKTQQRKATVQSSKAGGGKKVLDYQKMSDKDLLNSAGLSLFNEE